MKKMISVILLSIAILLGALALFLFAGKVQPAEHVTWGVNFSAKHAKALGLDWRATYAALLDELHVRHIKISLDWNDLEPEKDTMFFDDADWLAGEAEKRNAELVLVVGMKTMRWPECHVPEWARGLPRKEQQEEILALLEAVVSRYKGSPALLAWQVENEPFFPFGECPWHDRVFLEKEVALVKSFDAAHPVIVSDSGELSLWVRAAQAGDIVSTTMYRRVWFHEISRYITYPLPPTFYGRKAQVIKRMFDKEVIGGELQAEPWGPGKLLYKTSLEEQNAAFDLAQFKENIEFARKTGIDKHYLWGAEWWYWREVKAQDPTFWQEANQLFSME